MKIDFEDLIIRHEVPQWPQVKSALLEEIEQHTYGMKVVTKDGFSISDTNYFDGPPNYHYGDVGNKVFGDFYQTLFTKYKIASQKFKAWHQTYEKGDAHNWHTHPDADMSSILYIQLPDEECGTIFKFKDKTHQPKVKEGEIISFPGAFTHCSPRHTSDLPKTVISFNWQMITQ